MTTLPALRPSMPPEKAVTVGGHEMHYYEAGIGPTVILLHGLGASAEVWVTNINALAARFHVIAPDQIGFGRSAKPRIEYRVQLFADFLREFLQALGIEHTSLVGNSMGGWIAAVFAAQHPHDVDKLVLVDAAGALPPFPALNPSSVSEMRELLRLMFHDPARVTREFAEAVLQRRRQFDDFPAVERTIHWANAEKQSIQSALPQVEAPTLIVWGRDDRLCPPSDGELMHRLVPGSQLLMLEDCGHYPQLEKPAQVNAALIRFLSA
jgi:pimeloyl-ACP methyl ester carboxylesterase